jgi:hypothetical protein
MNIGTEFENDLASELGLQRVPGSGNQWHAKLDVKGRGTRWSLKATSDDGFRVSHSMIMEAIFATEGIGGTGEIPVWAIRLGTGDDFIIMRKQDWIRFMKDEGFSIPKSKSEERRQRAATPQLLREEE